MRPVVLLLIVTLAAWGGLTLANDWVRSQYYVGQNSGEVAIFQGVSQEVGFISLSRLHEMPGDLPVESLPNIYQDQVEATITADNIEDASEIVATLRRQACRAAGALEPEPEAEPESTPPTGEPDATVDPDTTDNPNPDSTRNPNPDSTGNPNPAGTRNPATNANAAGTSAGTGTPATADASGADDTTSDEGWVSTNGGLDCTGVR